MEIPSNSFKIRKSFNMVSGSPSVSKTTICAFYGRHGFCNNVHQYIHQDCKNYFKYQYCFQKLVNKCPYFHRVSCENWKKNGKCPIPECEFLHKNCENYQNYKICRRNDCPFFHSIQDKTKNSSNLFIRKAASLRVIQKKIEIRPNNQRNLGGATNDQSQTQLKSENEIKHIEKKEEILPNPPKKLMTYNENPFRNNEREILHLRNSPNFEFDNKENEKNSSEEEKKSESEESEEEEEEKNIVTPPQIKKPEISYQRTPAISLSNISNSQRLRSNNNLNPLRNDLSEESLLRPFEERHGNLTIVTLNRTNAIAITNTTTNEIANYPEGTIGHTLDRINQFSTHLRNIRESLRNQEGDLNFLNSRFRSLMEIQERLNIVRRQERIMGNLDSLIETFLLINAMTNTSAVVGLKLAEFEKIPIFLFGVDDDLKNKNELNYEDSSSRKMCAICLEDYKRNDLVKRLHCSHQYHEDCLREWTKKKINCPICKRNIKEDID